MLCSSGMEDCVIIESSDDEGPEKKEEVILCTSSDSDQYGDLETAGVKTSKVRFKKKSKSVSVKKPSIDLRSPSFAAHDYFEDHAETLTELRKTLELYDTDDEEDFETKTALAISLSLSQHEHHDVKVRATSTSSSSTLQKAPLVPMKCLSFGKKTSKQAQPETVVRPTPAVKNESGKEEITSASLKDIEDKLVKEDGSSTSRVKDKERCIFEFLKRIKEEEKENGKETSLKQQLVTSPKVILRPLPKFQLLPLLSESLAPQSQKLSGWSSPKKAVSPELTSVPLSVDVCTKSEKNITDYLSKEKDGKTDCFRSPPLPHDLPSTSVEREPGQDNSKALDDMSTLFASRDLPLAEKLPTRRDSSSTNSSDQQCKKMMKRRLSDKEVSKMSPAKRRCFTNWLHRLKEEKDRNNQKPKDISRKGVQQLMACPKVVLELLPIPSAIERASVEEEEDEEEKEEEEEEEEKDEEERVAQSPVEVLADGLPEMLAESPSESPVESPSESPAESPTESLAESMVQHRHFLDVLQSPGTRNEKPTVTVDVCADAVQTTKLPESYQEKFMTGMSTVAKRLRLKKRRQVDEEKDETSQDDEDVLPDLEDETNSEDEFQVADPVSRSFQESQISRKKKVAPGNGPTHHYVTSVRTSQSVEPEVGRKLKRDVNDRWWCSLPPRVHCRLSGLNDSIHLRMFAKTAVNMIDGGREEAQANRNYYKLVLHLVTDYANSKTEPPRSILRCLLIDLLPKSPSSDFTLSVYSTLQMFLDLYPPFRELCFSWRDLENTLDRICCQSAPEDSYILSYMVESLETELAQHSFTSQRNLQKSWVAKMLNVDTHLHRLKYLINCLGAIIPRNEYDGSDDYLPLKLGGDYEKEKKDSHFPFKPKLVNLVQRCLVLGLVTSRRQHDAASMVLNELFMVYKRLPNLSHRKVLIETMTWPVLRLQLTQRILEESCSGRFVNISCLTLTTIFHMYVAECTPPYEAVTPPLTPTDNGEPSEVCSHFYGEDSCEELAYLLFQLVQTYITFHKRGHFQSVDQRILNDCRDLPLGEVDLGAVPNLIPQIGILEKRLASMCHVLSSRTKLYLLQMKCVLL